MKTVAVMMLAFCATLFFGYLVGAFVAASWDISTWMPEAKAFLAMFTIGAAIIAAAAAEYYSK